MKLDYSKIQMLENSMNSRRSMALKIGMSPPGYKKMMENRSCTVETLVTIAKEFQKPLMYFFESEKGKNNMNEPGVDLYSCPDCIEKQKRLNQAEHEKHQLEEKIKDKQKIIDQCEELLEMYRDKKGNCTANSA